MPSTNNRSWREIEQDDIVQDIRRERQKRLDQIWRGKLLGARNGYLASKKRGENLVFVDEWDEFELQRDRERMKDLEKQGIKGEVKTMTKSLSVELSKDYCKVVVGVDDILEVDDFVQAKEWAWNEAMALLNRIPDGGYTKERQRQTPSQYTKQNYAPKPYEAQPQQSKVTKADIQCPMRLSDAQKGVAVKKINNGDLTLAQVNGCKDYNDFNRVVFNK